MVSSRNKSLYHTLLASCILCLSLGTTFIALAEYQPPPNPSAPRDPSRGTKEIGGCSTQSGLSLTALAPYSHVGQTVSTSPTVAWFVPDSESLLLKFSLYEYGGDNQPILEEDFHSSPGIMTFSLPNLSVGKRYRWQVELHCNPNRPSGPLLAGAEIEVVALSPILKTKLAATTDSLTKANLYAQEGLWYDAFGETLAATEDLKAKEGMVNLLDDLASLEIKAESQKIQVQGIQIRKIVQMEREYIH